MVYLRRIKLSAFNQNSKTIKSSAKIKTKNHIKDIRNEVKSLQKYVSMWAPSPCLWQLSDLWKSGQVHEWDPNETFSNSSRIETCKRLHCFLKGKPVKEKSWYVEYKATPFDESPGYVMLHAGQRFCIVLTWLKQLVATLYAMLKAEKHHGQFWGMVTWILCYLSVSYVTLCNIYWFIYQIQLQ